MAEKKKVKYTPPRDKTIPEELKKEKPISSAAEAQEDIEENLPKDTRKSGGSKGSLSKAQDDLRKGDITSTQAHKKAGITKDIVIPFVGGTVEAGVKQHEAVELELTKPKTDTVQPKVATKGKEGRGKETKVEKFKKITLEDGHTYHTAEKDAVCSSCMLSRDKTTTQCFKHELSPIAVRKFNDGLVDYINGVWVLLEKDDK